MDDFPVYNCVCVCVCVCVLSLAVSFVVHFIRSFISTMVMSLSKLRELVMDREHGMLQSMGSQRIGHD